MERLPRLITVASALAGFGVLSLTIAAGFSPQTANLDLGTDTPLKPGTTNLAKFNPDSLPAAGATASGSVKNTHGMGVPMTDLDIDVDNGSSGDITVNGQAKTPDANGNAHFEFNPPVNFQGTAQVSIAGLQKDSSGKDVEIDATPSYSRSVGSQVVEVNGFPLHGLSRAQDQLRTSILKAYHPAGLAFLQNEDSSQRINQIDGQLSFPAHSSAGLIDLALQDTLGNSLGGTVAYSGNTFSISNLSPIAAGNSVALVVRWSGASQGTSVQLRLTGSFVP